MKFHLLLLAFGLMACTATEQENEALTTAKETQEAPQPELTKYPISTENSKVDWERYKKVKNANSSFKIGKSNINFSVSNAELTTNGTFLLKEGWWLCEGDQLLSGVFEVDLANAVALQVSDETEKLELTSPQYLDVSQYPTARIEVLSITKNASDSCMVEANLSIKDTTGAISFPAQVMWEKHVPYALNGQFMINGEAWHLLNPKADQEIVADELTFSLSVSLE